MAPLYIVSPLAGMNVSFRNLFSDHPPTAERIRRLRSKEWARSSAGFMRASRRTAPRGRFSVPEVLELQGQAEVLFPQPGDHGLEVVALLARHAHLVALGLGGHALGAVVLDPAVDGPGVVGDEAGLRVTV